jgi:hypothetical protein
LDTYPGTGRPKLFQNKKGKLEEISYLRSLNNEPFLKEEHVHFFFNFVKKIFVELDPDWIWI